ncbi:hypothetical protein KIH24_05485 [Rhizobiales bacterium TNE-4]|nr:hypothetical protein [Rhizobiales bacterium TNE-4]MBV1827075.1 hypothetical protein [Rhizobiales bacterium TNE-4]
MPQKALQLSLAAFETSLAASVTIAARWPILLQTMHAPSRTSVAETRLMVDEKFAAMVEGAVAAQLATLSLAGKMMRGEIRHAGDLVRATTETMTVALKPARRRVVANAKRLTGL